jgi:hypothetical protein
VGQDPRHVICSAPSHPPDKSRHCGSSEGPGAGFFNVWAVNIKCPPARHVARHVFRTGNRNFAGWHCKMTPASVESERVNCGRDHRGRNQRVRFVIAA